MDSLVSIIVPVYNCKSYIEECVGSLLMQTYPNIEVILVNDGSTDGSAIICKQLEMSDSRVVVIDQKNEGVSSARNKGIQNAKGKFITFVDADDYVEIDHIENLLGLMTDSGIGICGYKRLEGMKIKKEYIVEENMDTALLYKNIFANNLIGSGCCNKLFISDVIRENILHFEKQLAVGEDMVFLAEYLKCVKNNFRYIEKTSYVYRKRQESAMQEVCHCSDLVDRKATCLDAVEKLNVLYDEPESGIEKIFAYRTVRSSLWLLFQMIVSNRFEKIYAERIQNNIRKNFKCYCAYREGSILERMMSCVTCLSPRLVYTIGKSVWKYFPHYIEKYLV